MFRIVAVLLTIGAVSGAHQIQHPPAEQVPKTSGDAGVNAEQVASPAPAFDVEQQMLVDFALERFERAGLELPSDLRITFPTDKASCFDYGGVYVRSKVEVRICRPSDTTMIHELAHAWIETTLTGEKRTEFMELRELDTWTGGEDWDTRGAEQSAEILTWALMDRDITHRWLVPGPNNTLVETFRLLKIDNSSYPELVEAYRLLTGAHPIDRHAPVTSSSDVSVSPEARRAGLGEASDVGGLRQNGVIVSPEAVRRGFDLPSDGRTG